jgi:acyl-CoA synthetase (AMP-forming)/AMP-acid ligase II
MCAHSPVTSPSPLPHPPRLPQRQVYAYAHGLIEALGLKKGEKVVAWMTNELEHLVLQYSAALVGVTVVDVDPKLDFDAVL